MNSPIRPTRRLLFQGALGCTMLALAGCGTTDQADSNSSADASAKTTPEGTTVNLGKASEIPVGGGAIFPDHQIVVTQPTKGTFLAFSALCTHQGVEVNQVIDGTIRCPAHGSQFSVKDGSPVAGPANRPLAKLTIKVAGGDIVATL